MPRLTLQRKVFLALALLLAALLSLFVLLSRVGLQRGLGEYVAAIELSRLDWMVDNLQRAYALQGSWSLLARDGRAWQTMQMPGGVDFRDRPWPPHERTGHDGQLAADGELHEDGGRPHWGREGRPPWVDVLPWRFSRSPTDHPGDPRTHADSVFRRLALLEADGRGRVAGFQGDLADAPRTAVRYQGRTVGFLAVAPPQGLALAASRSFVEQQSAFVLYTGLAGLLLALAISAWAARRWLRPVQQLAEAARTVASGRFDVVVPVRGSDELAMLTETFNAMAVKLAAVEESRQRWLADVAHELRTPVAAMRAEIEAVQDGVRSFDGATAARLHAQAMRLGKLVEDLRLVTTDAHADLPIARAELRPLPLLIEAVEAMRQRLQGRDIAIEGLDQVQQLAARCDIVIDGDAGRLVQVFSNLLENSLRYTQAGGKLVVSAVFDPSQSRALTLSFDDSAPAPRADQLPRLFDRFFRGENSRDRAFGGAGLGLSICRTIVEGHGGSIAATLSPLGGLRITIALPARQP